MSDDTDLDLEREMAEFEKQSATALAKESSAPTAEQGSAAWLAERVGHCTGSEFANVMATRKDKKEAAPRYNYRMELVVERLTGEPSERYVSKYMEWGTEHEPAARMAYEAHTGAMMMQPGFRHHPTVTMCGGSVDGEVGNDGIIEIKCPTTFTHIETLLHGMDAEHVPQVQGYLWITGRKWCDFVSFDPRLPAGLQLYVQRIARDDDFIAELAGNVIQFLSEVAELHQKLLAIAGPQAIQAQDESRAPADSAFDVATQI